MKRKPSYRARKAGGCFIFHNRGIVPGVGFVENRKEWNAMPVARRQQMVERFLQEEYGQ